jgi:hypothetical protein
MELIIIDIVIIDFNKKAVILGLLLTNIKPLQEIL